MQDLVLHDPLVFAGAAIALSVAAGGAFLLGRLSRSGGPSPQAAQKAAEPDSSEEETRELRKSLWILQNESKNLSNFLTLLPDFARELNSTFEKRKVTPLLKRMIDQIFDPQQILIFLVTHHDDGLFLAEEKGLPPEHNRTRIIPYGEGRVGWIASQQISMDESDFEQKGRFLGGTLDPSCHPHFRVELAAPMVHKERTLGVITVGGMLRHPRNEKTMLRMVADLGSIALNNAYLFQKMEQIANSDGLTGLCTKRFFMARLADEIIRAERRHEEFSLFIFDIDHFKNYNDSNGHPAGDEALRTTGRIVKEMLREDDVPARYGGEEFIVLLPGTPKQGGAIAAEKIRAAIQSHEYPKEKSQPGGDLTISGGVACYPFDGRTAAELISAADEALYKAKRGGRNRVVVHEPQYLSEPEEPEAAPVLAGRSA